MLRQFYIWPGLCLLTVGWGFLSVLLSYLFPRKELPHWCAQNWARMLLMMNGSRVRVHGAEQIQDNGQYLFFCNHQSWVDIVVITGYLPCPSKWVSKKEIFRVPFLGWHMRRAGYISVDTENPSKAVRSMTSALEAVKKGYSLVIFPEGTRSTDGKLLPFKRGSFALARMGGRPVVPVAIVGTRDILPKGSLKIQRADVDIYVGKPLEPGQGGRESLSQLMEKTRRAILEHLEPWLHRPH